MALDIVAQDIIIDETTGLQDDDVNSSVPPHTNATVQYLLSLDGPGGLTSPEVAFKANFVVASASAGETITSVVLTQNLTGTPFSTTVGVNSGIRTVDGNYVWLFQDATHANVVIGVIGTSDPAAEPAADRAARLLVRADQHQQHQCGPVHGPVCAVVPSGCDQPGRPHRSD